MLVEDSQIALVILRRVLNLSEQIEVVGEARDGLEALRLIPKVQPDVICADLYMPKMNGLEFTSEVMALYPRPILVISASVQEEDTHHIFQLLDAGALDIFPKPRAGLIKDGQSLGQELIEKIKVLAGVKVLKRRKSPQLERLETGLYASNVCTKPKVVVIGASTGGPPALQELFVQLPANFPIPVICVQHICLGFLQGFIDWLAHSCRLPIEIARPGDIPKSGTIYFPPEQQHLELGGDGQFVCSDSPPLEGHRPSVTVTFESVAKIYGRATLGILLTGMGKDGARGMHFITQCGGFTIAQDEATSVVFGMPQAAIALGGVKQVLPIQAIAPMLLELLQQETS